MFITSTTTTPPTTTPQPPSQSPSSPPPPPPPPQPPSQPPIPPPSPTGPTPDLSPHTISISNNDQEDEIVPESLTTTPPTTTPQPPSQSPSSPPPPPPQPPSQPPIPPPSPTGPTPDLSPHTISISNNDQEDEIVPEAPTSITPTTTTTFRQRAQTFTIAIFLQLLFALLNLFAKLSMDDGRSSFVFVAYRSIVAFMVVTPFALYFQWNQLPKITTGIFFRILATSLLGLLDQNLYLLGMKYTTATYATAMSNLLPVITFILACIHRTETINLGSRRHQAKVLGTILIVLGAMVMTMVKGSILFGTVGAINHGHHGGSHTIVGLIFILLGCTSFAYSSILQTILINEYHFPALSLVSTNSFLGSIGGLIVAWIVESRSSYTVWTIFRWDLTLLSIIYAV
ncbi:WAT1-related protein At2g37460-like [Trifolium pratense]|uniref:WAT1-related protein At2g37460-like n=1 Tax=Trifolium pratense TaxID=57577 RepID=UPI001E6961A6|nr:WAT1-related protein At2g37460-like [Trifolium pratense]